MNAKQFNFSIRTVLFIVAIFISVLLWMVFFNAADLSLEEVISIGSIEESFQKITTLNFILFVIFFPLSYAIVAAMAKYETKLVSVLGSIVGFLLAFLIGFLLFQNIVPLGMLALFYVISLVLVVESATVKYNEVKKYVSARVSWSCVSTGTIIVGFGVLITVALTVMPNQKFYVNDFEEGIIDIVQEAFEGDSTSDLEESTVDSLIARQRSMVDQFLSTPMFLKLKTKVDPDVQAFVALMEETRDQIDSPENRQNILNELETQKKDVLGSAQIRDLIRGIPGYDMINNFYWLLASFFVFSIFLLLRIPFVFLGMIYGTILGFSLGKMMPKDKTEKNEKSEETEEKPKGEGKGKPKNAVQQKLTDIKK